MGHQRRDAPGRLRAQRLLPGSRRDPARVRLLDARLHPLRRRPRAGQGPGQGQGRRPGRRARAGGRPPPGRSGSEPRSDPTTDPPITDPIQHMPRLRQVPKDEATAPIVTTMYEWLFEGRDPVAEPGRWDGTTGDWWTVFANSPDILDHCVKGFGLYQSPDRTLDPTLRELGQIRAGYAAASQFVYSQHAKSMRELGMPEEQITHIPAWSIAPEGTYDAAERAVLAYTDCLVYDHGRVPDELFAELQRHLDDVAILELTYITTLYFQHAVMSKALRTEFDDRDDPIVEVAGPVGSSAMHPGRIGDGGARRPAGRRSPAHPRRRGPVERVLLLRLRAGRRLHGRLAPARPLPQPPGGVVDDLDRLARPSRRVLGRLRAPGAARRRPGLGGVHRPRRHRRPADRDRTRRPLESFRLAASAPARLHRPARGRLHPGRADRPCRPGSTSTSPGRPTASPTTTT